VMKLIKISLLAGLFVLSSCQKYLDVIPDNVATIDNAFAMRNVAERYLFTCYSWLPYHNAITGNPAFLGGQEIWPVPNNTAVAWGIPRGLQNVQSPILNYWDGWNSGRNMFEGIRDCNIFLENIHRVPDMPEYEKDRWKAEVKFLKAYYHFWLFRLYGPIPLIDESLPIDASIDDIRVKRNTVDESIDFIVSLLDEAMPYLPPIIESEASELGRITQPIALSIKAQVLVTAASPLYNGNSDYMNFKDKDGVQLFNSNYDASKWVKATQACKEAVEACEQVGFRLYEYQQQLGQTKISDTTRVQMSIRNSVTERWNSEVIWGNTNSVANQNYQLNLTPRSWDPARSHNAVQGRYAPPLKIVEMFYSEHGVPIEEDKIYDYAGRFDLRNATSVDRYNIRDGYTTIGLHFNRENRFYATIGFDGGIWYGQGRLNDNDPFYLMGKAGQITAMAIPDAYSATGYWAKKLINPQNVLETSSYTVRWYPWPVMRLADLYLLYAEALNESEGPDAEDLHKYINLVRARVKLEPVADAWTKYSRQPDKYKTKEGMRDIIRRERKNELALEGVQYWDLLRWKVAHDELSTPIVGWSLTDRAAQGYYRKVTLFQPTFLRRDYLMPLSEQALLRNDNLVQNPGW
jgi:hypothetical protein